MPKRPDYGDATPEDSARALVRYQRPPPFRRPEKVSDANEQDTEGSDHRAARNRSTALRHRRLRFSEQAAAS